MVHTFGAYPCQSQKSGLQTSTLLAGQLTMWDLVPPSHPALPATIYSKCTSSLRSLCFLIYKLGLTTESSSQHHREDPARTVYKALCCDHHTVNTQTWLDNAGTSSWSALHIVLCCGLYYKYQVLPLQQIKRIEKHPCLKTLFASGI